MRQRHRWGFRKRSRSTQPLRTRMLRNIQHSRSQLDKTYMTRRDFINRCLCLHFPCITWWFLTIFHKASAMSNIVCHPSKHCWMERYGSSYFLHLASIFEGFFLPTLRSEGSDPQDGLNFSDIIRPPFQRFSNSRVPFLWVSMATCFIYHIFKGSF